MSLVMGWLGCGLEASPGTGTGTEPTNPGVDSGSAAVTASGWCAVRATLTARCLSCHSTALALGALDLEAAPYDTLLDATSAYGGHLVVPGKPDDSVLVHKLRGRSKFGGIMPPGGALPEAAIAAVEEWISSDATDACADPSTTAPVPETYHPTGWASPARHGIATNLQQEDCTSCHGEQLEGGTVGVACRTCHDAVVADWTTSCTFCHGEPADGTGAPPRDIDGNQDPATITFPAHRVHLSSATHADWTCDQCHANPQSVFTPGHLFVGDTTPGHAELSFAAGLAADTRASPETCTNVYCHGDGRTPGDVPRGGSVSCGDCHPTQATPSSGSGLSAPHEDHLDEDIACAACHPTVDDAGALVDSARHIDGTVTVQVAGLTRSPDGTCTGTCHDESHSGRAWRESVD